MDDMKLLGIKAHFEEGTGLIPDRTRSYGLSLISTIEGLKSELKTIYESAAKERDDRLKSLHPEDKDLQEKAQEQLIADGHDELAYALHNYFAGTDYEIEGLKGEVERLTNERDTAKGFHEVYDQAHKDMKRDRDTAIQQVKRYRKALEKIVCLNIPMPDEVFTIANNALEGNSHD